MRFQAFVDEPLHELCGEVFMEACCVEQEVLEALALECCKDLVVEALPQ